ncbi:unnamed protein product [Adineta steineri]|uniref:Uncharacterized protein n=1 Tax=Adineta steineri TaxID=433720 RepID=A0A814TZ27_9BILA|nr:unnamed protein product [Adineta steineri]CAF1286451.1 unnamed protein product [Adineta steineri]CAF3708406.1 unnamed protein product [Adineta steineri]CAF3776817.1 unnamed protein product [Adineta steineri]
MTTETGKSRCFTCDKEKRTVRCEGCLQTYCYDHLTDHRQELNKQLDHITLNYDRFRRALNEQTNHPQIILLTKQINKWELDAINKIQQTASECRQLLLEVKNEHSSNIKINLEKLTEQLGDIRQENDFNEIDLQQFKDKLAQLQQELNKPSNISIQKEYTSYVNKISVVASSEADSSFLNIHNNTKWKQSGTTIIGVSLPGNQAGQLYDPRGICIHDADEQMIYIADLGNHRIMEWKCSTNTGQVVAGGNGQGNRMDQLDRPTNVIIDKMDDSLIISDWGNSRVVRWSLRNNEDQQTIIFNIDCCGLTMDHNGDLYVSDLVKNEVRRWKDGDTNGIVVAGGNGEGDTLNQLNYPSYIFVDEDQSVYVSDTLNHRVMKWPKGAKEGIIVAGGQGQGNSLSQLSCPMGVIVDYLGNLYVADFYNHRIVRWAPGARKGSIVVGGNGQGTQPDQLNGPTGLSMDQHGNLYVVNRGNHDVHKFDIDLN